LLFAVSAQAQTKKEVNKHEDTTKIEKKEVKEVKKTEVKTLNVGKAKTKKIKAKRQNDETTPNQKITINEEGVNEHKGSKTKPNKNENSNSTTPVKVEEKKKVENNIPKKEGE